MLFLHQFFRCGGTSFLLSTSSATCLIHGTSLYILNPLPPADLALVVR